MLYLRKDPLPRTHIEDFQFLIQFKSLEEGLRPSNYNPPEHQERFIDDGVIISPLVRKQRKGAMSSPQSQVSLSPITERIYASMRLFHRRTRY
ncbi:hypothetical protein CDAR_544831 [Caerostris darwini]|uniref:Uncharacterized protein n=1 Tax=Caerostris darwini TaxID=1538125 RepID=A0AAV4NIB5_9ARAC|nr:hypothetical protein CDAR_544831 [Caerostris darwini]